VTCERDEQAASGYKALVVHEQKREGGSRARNIETLLSEHHHS